MTIRRTAVSGMATSGICKATTILSVLECRVRHWIEPSTLGGVGDGSDNF